jgi:probable rRNA maturation factor
MILSEPPSITRSRKLGAPLSKRELGRFLSEARQQVGLSGEVTILLTTDERLRELNRAFRGKDAPTDVLSFPAEPSPQSSPESGYSGDLAISIEIAARQAESFAHPVLTEVKVLILHGLLHLAGLDHETDRGQMARRERALREHFELPAGLIQRAERPGRVRQKATA